MKQLLQEIDSKAQEHAKRVGSATLAAYGDTGACGFAWVCIGASLDGRSKEARALKSIGLDKHWRRGFMRWNPAQTPCQSIYVLERGAQAYADEFNRLAHFYEIPIQAFAQSRLD